MTEPTAVPPAPLEAKPAVVNSDGAKIMNDPNLVTFVIVYDKSKHDANVTGQIYMGMDFWYAAIGIATDKIRKLNEANFGYCRLEKAPPPDHKKKGGFFGGNGK